MKNGKDNMTWIVDNLVLLLFYYLVNCFYCNTNCHCIEFWGSILRCFNMNLHFCLVVKILN